MKKSGLLLVILVLGIVMTAGAQTQIGVIGAVNLANISVDPKDQAPDFSNRMGFGIGGILALGLGQNLALQFEPMYLQKGAEAEETDPTIGTAKLTFKLDYIEIPALLKIAFGSSPTKFYIMAGPAVGILTSAKLRGEISGQSAEVDIKETVKDVDWGAAFGAGVSFPAGSNSIFVQGRYALGLSDINNDTDDPDTKIKNKGIHILGGIAFPLGGK